MRGVAQMTQSSSQASSCGGCCCCCCCSGEEVGSGNELTSGQAASADQLSQDFNVSTEPVAKALSKLNKAASSKPPDANAIDAAIGELMTALFPSGAGTMPDQSGAGSDTGATGTPSGVGAGATATASGVDTGATGTPSGVGAGATGTPSGSDTGATGAPSGVDTGATGTASGSDTGATDTSSGMDTGATDTADGQASSNSQFLERTRQSLVDAGLDPSIIDRVMSEIENRMNSTGSANDCCCGESQTTGPNSLSAEAIAANPELAPYADDIAEASRQTGLDPLIIAAMIHSASGGDQGVSSTNPDGSTDVGLMRISQGRLGKDNLSEEMKAKISAENGKPFDQLDVSNPHDNIIAGAWHMKHFTEQGGGDVDKGLRSYRGEGDPQYVENIHSYASNLENGQPMTSGSGTSGTDSGVDQPTTDETGTQSENNGQEIIPPTGSNSLIAKSIAGNPELEPYADFIAEAARQTGIDPMIIGGMIHAESRGNPATSTTNGDGSNDVGLMQISQGRLGKDNLSAAMKARILSENGKPFDQLDVSDPRENIIAGSWHLKHFLEQSGGNMNDALGSYVGRDPLYIGNVTRFAMELKTGQSLTNEAGTPF